MIQIGGVYATFCQEESTNGAAKRWGFKRGGVSRSGLVLPFLSFFVLFGTFLIFFGIFPICAGTLRGFSRFVLFLFLGLLTAPTRNSPERVLRKTKSHPLARGLGWRSCGLPVVHQLIFSSRSLDGRNRAIVIAESLARVLAAIRIASVRWRSYLENKRN